MQFIDLVKKRQSCRKYSPDPVSREVLDRCLEAARLAPSACNSQPWKFIVIQDAHIKERLNKEAFSGLYSSSSFAYNAPIIVAVVRDSKSYTAKLGSLMRRMEFSLIDIGIACEHFVLKAAEEGLGTCWIGWFNEKDVKKTLGLSSREKVDILISAGYPLEEALRNKVRKSLDEIREYR